MEMLLIYPVFVGMGIATAELAREKGYKGRWWFLLGSLVPLVSTIVLFMMKRKETPRVSSPIVQPEAAHSDKILYQKPL